MPRPSLKKKKAETVKAVEVDAAPAYDAKAAAAAEERRMAELLAQSRKQQEDPATVATPAENESLVSVMAKGREHLMQRMREHMEAEKAKKEAYKPPPMTDRQRANLEAEMAAGRRAQERHAAAAAARPVPPRDPSEGTSTPVHRPGNLVPDPRVSAPSGFVAGSAQYSADA